MYATLSIVISLLTVQAAGHAANSFVPSTSLLARANALDEHRPIAYGGVYASVNEVKQQGSHTNSHNPIQAAKTFAKKVEPDATFRVVEEHSTGRSGVTHVYLKQTVHGVDVINGDMNINVCRSLQISIALLMFGV
jgi:extracellular elastinolytic metalloproteinase